MTRNLNSLRCCATMPRGTKFGHRKCLCVLSQEVPVTEQQGGAVGQEEARREVAEIVAAADRLGVELDATEALQWIIAVSAAEREAAFAQDSQSGIFGHR